MYIMLEQLATLFGGGSSLLGSYLLTSLVLFKYPHIFHKKKNVVFVARHICHRGGAAEHYENTMAAFKRVVELGTDMLEIDCQITKDGKVVVAHDKNLLRLTGVDADISSLPYDQLPVLKESLPIDFEPGKYYRHANPEMADRRIPLLEEVFHTFDKIPINIDVKSNDDLLIQQVSQLISRYERESLCVWGNMSAEITNKCYQQNKNVNVFCSRRKVIAILLCYYVGLLPFIPIKETHLEIFLPSLYLRWPTTEDSWKRRAFIHVLELLLIRKSLFLYLQKRGIQVYLWVLNDEKQFERAFRAGATGVITDYPTRLVHFLDSNTDIVCSPAKGAL